MAMACVGNQTFELILRQPVLLHHFQIYLSKSLAEENLVFLKTLREVKSSSLELSDPVAIRNDIQKLIEEFFLPSSPMELNIPSSLRKRLLTEIEELEVFEPHSFAIFEEAEKHIIGVLNNRVKTFYRDYMKQSSETLIPALKSSQKRVVVLGGGFCGALLASILDKMPRFNVCLIDSKTFFEYTPSVVKEIPNPSTVDNIRIPHSEIVQNGHFVLGYVDSVTPHHVSLGNVEIPFDYLAIATGSTYASHIKAANISSTYRSKKLSYEHQRLVKSRNVLIVGGGSVGVEIAAELACAFPDKKITLVEANSYLLKRLTKKAHLRSLEYLQGLGVEVILNERITQYDESRRVFKSKSGRLYKFDMIYLATGPQPQSSFMKERFAPYIDDRKRIKVLPSLQLPGHANILAGGDVTTIKEEKTAYAALISAVTIARNICRLEKGKDPLLQGEKGTKAPQQTPLIQFVSLGPKEAMAIINNSHVFVSPKWAKIKSNLRESTFKILRGEPISSFRYGQPPSTVNSKIQPRDDLMDDVTEEMENELRKK